MIKNPHHYSHKCHLKFKICVTLLKAGGVCTWGENSQIHVGCKTTYTETNVIKKNCLSKTVLYVLWKKNVHKMHIFTKFDENWETASL